jgi:ubiquinone/menaquinone biosynthesis C-methylase UbiE
LREIPADDGQFTLVVCGLALAHVADLSSAIAELARVLAPGGRLILALLGWHAPFLGDGGQRWFVREHPHTHADYLNAFHAAGLRVQRCIEPQLSAAEVATKRRAFRSIPDATTAAYLGLPAVLIWETERDGA